MTVTTNANYDAKNALRHKHPQFVVEFEGESQQYATLSISIAYEALQIDGVDLSIDGEVLQTEQT